MEWYGRPARRAGYVLVGGRSARMGRDKALLPWEGGTLAGYVAARVEAAAGSVMLVGSPERYGTMGYPVIADLRPECGPLGGIEAALSASEARWNLIVACDMPGLTTGFLASLFRHAEACGGDCLVAVSPAGFVEPLCAVWSCECLPAVTAALDRGKCKTSRVFNRLRTAYWRASQAAWFENLNTPDDWAGHGTVSLEAVEAG
jgi:molybdopterin-guanine dinucleotide biosynthesis protein A